MYQLRYSDRVRTIDLPKLDASVRGTVSETIIRKLTVAPDAFGKPLRHSLRLLRVLRVGDWRVIYQLSGNEVFIVSVRHRREGYEDIRT